MIDISVKDLVKSYDADENILKGISFDVQQGERVGLLGKNGAGKTTLFRILTGEIDYNSGEIAFAQGKKVGLISQIPRYPAGYTVEEVLRTAFTGLEKVRKRMQELEHRMTEHTASDILREYDDLSNRYAVEGGYETDLETDKVCNGLAISPEQRQQEFDSLSGGEKTRVNLARLLLEKTDILLLDEPTNHLDMHSVEWLEGYISKFKGTVLTISHDRYFLDQVVSRIIEIRDGKAEFYSGNYTFYVAEKQARYEMQLRQYEKEQAKIAQLEKAADQLAAWAYSGMDKTYKRVVNIERRIERMRTVDKPTQDRQMKARFAEKSFFGDEVLSVKGLGKAFDGRTLFENVELQVAGGERVALLGDNGTGKTTFLKVLLGEDAGVGKIKFGPTVKWAYLPQIIHFAHPERTLLDTMLYETGCTPQAARDRLGAYLFSGEDVFKTVGSLSGGEQSRLRLCMLMDEKINLLILDEPTNHLDIAAREWVEDALQDYEGTLIFVSHDRYFVDKFATRVWELENGEIRDFPCGYAKYRSIRQHERMLLEQQPKQKKEHKEKPKNSSSNNKQLERKVRQLEREIEKQEQLVADFDPQIEAAAQDYQELARLMEEKQQAEDRLAEMMDEWETLSLSLEEQA